MNKGKPLGSIGEIPIMDAAASTVPALKITPRLWPN